MFASCFVNALVSKGIAVPPETIEDINDTSLQSLQQMRASTGIQPRASRLPALDPTFSAKVRLRAPPKSLPAFKVFEKTTANIVWNDTRKPILPKGAKLLAILPSNADNRGSDDGAWDLTNDSESHEHIQDVQLQ